MLHQYESNATIHSSPVIAPDGTVYIGCNFDGLFSLNQSLSKKWLFDTRSSIEGAPVVARDGTVYAGAWNHALYAISPTSEEKWKWPYVAREPIQSSPVIDGQGTIFFGANDGLYAVNPDGSKKWRKAIPDGVKSSPAIGTEHSLIVGGNDGKIYCFQYRPQLWMEDITIAEDLVIPDGQAIVIEPGTHIRVHSQGGHPLMETKLQVYGTIKAIGTEEKPIIFEAIDPDTSRDKWYGIWLSETSERNEFRHCIFRNAVVAVHGNGNWSSRYSDIVSNCEFQYCGTAVSLTGRCHTYIADNTIRNCDVGVDVNTSRATITNNWISDITGDAVRGVYSTLEIHKNCLLDYDQHGISLGSADAQIVNNVIFTRHGANTGHAIYEYTNPDVPRWGVPDVSIKNNVLMTIYKAPVFCRSNSLGELSVFYNLCYGFVGTAGENLAQADHNLIDQDPLFVDMEWENKYGFLLAPGSPCIDAGDPEIKDIDGSFSDIGVYGGPPVPPPVLYRNTGLELQKAMANSMSAWFNWPDNDVDAYNVYRADAQDSIFQRLNMTPVQENRYYIGNQQPGYFMIRSLQDDIESYDSRRIWQYPSVHETWADHFDDAQLDKNYWQAGGDAGSVVQESGQALHLQLNNTTSAELDGLFEFSGDFDIELRYTMQLPDTSGSGLQFIVENDAVHYSIGRVFYLDRTTLDGKIGHMFSCDFGLGEPAGYSLSATPTDSIGALRIVRIGSDISFYFQNDSAWTLLESRSLTTAPLSVRLRLFASNPMPNLGATINAFIVYNGNWVNTAVAATCRHVPDQYATIQEAVDAAVSGDTIQVAAGIYPLTTGILNNSVDNLHLFGAWMPGGADMTLLDVTKNPGTFDALRFENVSDCEIAGFVIQRAKNGIAMSTCSESEIYNCYIRDCDEAVSWHGNAIVIGGDSRHINLHHCILDRNEFHAVELHRAHHIDLYNNTITRTLGYDGIIFGETCSYIDIRNNIIAYGNEEGIEITGAPEHCTLDYNCYWKNQKSAVAGGKPGEHALFRDPLFVDIENGNFSLQRESPCWMRGENGSTMGAVATFFTGVRANDAIPLTFQMNANYPNPFNDCTRIDFQLPTKQRVKVMVMNILGQRVYTLLDETRLPGDHSVLWRGENQLGLPTATGVYFCVILTPEWSDVQKMLLMR